jgi:hypothetical protein
MTVIAVLQVLAFGDAVGADQNVDFTRLMGHGQRLLFGARRKQREHGLKIYALAAGWLPAAVWFWARWTR